MLGATIQQMPGWCADLNYAASMGACVWEMWRPSGPRVVEFRRGELYPDAILLNTDIAFGMVHLKYNILYFTDFLRLFLNWC